jgi:hypothetical protein
MESINRQLTNALWARKDKLLPNVWLQDLGEGSDKEIFKLRLVYDGKEHVDEEFMTNIYRAYYRYLVENGGKIIPGETGQESSVAIQNMYITCGLDFGTNVTQNDILSASNNVLPSYVRHYFTVPTPIHFIPKLIEQDGYTLPISSVEFINSRIIDNLLAQQKMPGKLKIHFNMIKTGTLELTSTVGNTTHNYTVKYELNPHSLSILTNQNNHRVEGRVLISDKMRCEIYMKEHDLNYLGQNNDTVTDLSNISSAILLELTKRLHLNKLNLLPSGQYSSLFNFNKI